MKGNPAAGILLIVAGIVGFLALVSGNLDRWLSKATGATAGSGSVFGLAGPSSAMSSSNTSQSTLAGRGSNSTAASNPHYSIGGSHLN